MSIVSLSDVIAYAEDKFGRLKCPLCGCRAFTPAAPTADKPIALLYENSGRSWFGPPGYLRVYALSCNDCSFIVTFKLEALENWMASREAESGTDS
ncbi:MAG TPA: hypothetical protein VFO41_18125 [Alphaproteobacteria bacterium]|nr:hypothetical protein [Alphaproteobacteria bacterium]